jgi:LPS-assembly lipoprotein
MKVGKIRHCICASLAAIAGVILSGCGFHPLYGTTSATGIAGMLTEVYVEPIPDRVGYQLRNDLLDLFNGTGRADNAAYRLKLSLNEEEQAVALQTNTNITRYNYTLRAHYELIPKGSTEAATKGELTTLTAYNVAAAPYLYATVTAERDAKDRAASDLAERIRIAIAVYLRGRPDKGG